MPGFADYSIPKQNDDFSSLEQHIEDLTQEKFSLQRDLDASRALAESLASENSSMTDTYNQQRSIVNQLKDDMEKLNQQIQAQMVVHGAIRDHQHWMQAVEYDEHEVQRCRSSDRQIMDIADLLPNSAHYYCLVDASWKKDNEEGGIGWSLHSK
ncbi:hypothetical protein F2Q69_00053543 [Brassica cretica]|uniref:Uncharacterized protein n=1 Tax=Brassica cretica TaxID=69181 RepID=A0A8S9N9A6_BRACR|nr:hypothetical protein F2Q69_00053543 [Brassica cretica]